jgi:HAD superfamily hydrolase (TIGR01509 family)
MIRAVLFDFDGVVVNSEPFHLRSFRELLAPLGIKISESRHYSEFVGIGSNAIIAMLFKEHGINYDVKPWVEKRKAIFQRYVAMGKVKPKKGVRKLLIALKKKGIRTAIVSGGHSSNIKSALEKIKLEGFFDILVSLEDVKRRKPHPEGFLLAARRLGVKPSQCIAIEDSNSGVSAAHSAKMKVVCIKSPVKINRKKCDFVISGFSRFPHSAL